MAFVFVYLQRHPLGLHPASSVALCSARDFASRRGASVLALCEGQDERHDKLVAAQAGQRGADQLVFCDRAELTAMYDDLGPRVVWCPATPWSMRAVAAMTSTELDPSQDLQPQTQWLTAPEILGDEFPPVVQLYAGVLPWLDFSTELIPQDRRRFEADEISLEETLPDASSPDFSAPLRIPKPAPSPLELFYLIPSSAGMDGAEIESLRSSLAHLGAKEVAAPSEVPAQQMCLWLDGTLPADLPRDPQWCLLPGVDYTDDFRGWEQADWVLPGNREDALALLQSGIWKQLVKTA